MKKYQGTDLRAEVNRIRWAALRSLIVCAAAYLLGYLLLPAAFDFPTELPERLTFVFQADLFIMLWVLFGSGMVSHGRRQRIEDIWGSAFGPPSPSLAIKIAFLQNTLEQAVMAVGAHLVLATLISGASLSVIVVSIALFGLGQISFYRGYSKGAGGRAFGMVTTALPTIFAFIASLILIALRLF